MIPQHATLEISRSRLKSNLALIQERLAAHSASGAIGGRAPRLCATVKANAYGHGAATISRLLYEAGVRWFAVYALEEVAEVLDSFDEPNGSEMDVAVLVMAPLVLTKRFAVGNPVSAALRPEVRVNVIDEGSALRLSAALANEEVAVAAAGNARRLRVHIQVDTGLTRCGVAPAKLNRLVDVVASSPGLELEGIFAHFSHADVFGHPSVEDQRELFHECADPVKRKYPAVLLHLQNSAGAWHVADPELDLARVGIALYGLQPNTGHPVWSGTQQRVRQDGDRGQRLEPIARMTAPILAIHECGAGVGVGYGHTFVTRRPSRLAIVPAGYAEGLPRCVSNNCIAQFQGIDVPVIGRISMDQVVVDVTDAARPAEAGEPVTLVSWDPQAPNCLDRLADAAGTIGYEIATHLGPRLKRVAVD